MGLCGPCGLPARIITHGQSVLLPSCTQCVYPDAKLRGNNLNALYYLFEHMSMELIYLFTPSQQQQ